MCKVQAMLGASLHPAPGRVTALRDRTTAPSHQTRTAGGGNKGGVEVTFLIVLLCCASSNPRQHPGSRTATVSMVSARPISVRGYETTQQAPFPVSASFRGTDRGTATHGAAVSRRHLPKPQGWREGCAKGWETSPVCAWHARRWAFVGDRLKTDRQTERKKTGCLHTPCKEELLGAKDPPWGGSGGAEPCRDPRP